MINISFLLKKPLLVNIFKTMYVCICVCLLNTDSKIGLLPLLASVSIYTLRPWFSNLVHQAHARGSKTI